MSSLKHGYSRHPLYSVWNGIKNRCYNKNEKQYGVWGGRGISVCDEWINNPKAFIEWALKSGYKKGLFIDRINNDMDYEPNNCRFITRANSNRNTQLLRSTNTTGYRGVSKMRGIYVTKITVGGRQRHLGYFPSPGLAGLRYDAEAFRLNDGRPMNFIGRD